MSDWLRGFVGFTPQVKKTTTTGPGNVNNADAPTSPTSPFTGGGVDKFERTNPLFSGNLDVGNLVNNISKLPVGEAKNQLNTTTSGVLETAAKNPNFEFPPIQG